jgi:hypothetical protein
MIRLVPQRVVLALLAGAATVPASARGQAAAATQLWNLTASTLPQPAALTTGGAAAFWNPAQVVGTPRAVAGLEIVQTSPVVGASGFLAAIRTRVAALGDVGLLYARMEISDLTRTSASPQPDAGSIPYHAASVGLTWSRALARATVGAALRFNESRLDVEMLHRWTFDVGMQYRVGALRVGAATHLVSAVRSDAAQDVYAAAGIVVWRGEPWSGSRKAIVELRYGLSFGHGFPPDHGLGVGLDFGEALGVDVMLAREGAYQGSAWRPVGGLCLAVGRYRVTVARDGGVNRVGAAFRAGLAVGFGR